MAEIFISGKVLRYYNVTPTEFYYLAELFLEKKATYKGLEQVLEDKGYITNDPIKLTEKGYAIFTDKDPSLLKFVDKYRLLFKKLSNKVGIMGDRGGCYDKFVRFFRKYPEYADRDLILKAAATYIKSEAKSQYYYLQKADYFIFKQDNSKIETSRCASYCEEIILNGNEEISNDNDFNTINV